MSETHDTTTTERRETPRRPLQGNVTVHLQTEPVVGPGENISSKGVFFVADTSLRVVVKLDGEDREIPGELVRIQSMGEGRTGIAIRFEEGTVV